MKKDTNQSAQSAFAITFTSANPNEYPVIYAEDQWHTAAKNDKICQLYDNTHSGSNTTATGAQFTQREINETLASTIGASNASITTLDKTVNTLSGKVSSLESGIVNVYRFKGSVNSLTELTAKNEESRVGDVYNLKTTGMNYAFIGNTEYVHCDGKEYTEMKLLDYAKKCLTQTVTEQIPIEGVPTKCTVGATQDSNGNYLLYAFVGEGSPTNRYVNWPSYNKENGYQVSNTEVFLTVLSEQNMWDALGESQSLTLWEE